ncbi:c-type cytochrome [Sulfurimonas sp.]
MKKLLFSTLLLSGSLFAQNAQEIINDNGCLACHAVASKKEAPAFAGIAKRNMRFEGSHAKETIINSIKNGSQGKYPMFSQSAMPAFPNLSEEQLNTLADYILLQASKAQCNRKRKGMMGM